MTDRSNRPVRRISPAEEGQEPYLRSLRPEEREGNGARAGQPPLRKHPQFQKLVP